jgi:5-methylcytosine-specific restriction endonuclease McrA
VAFKDKATARDYQNAWCRARRASFFEGKSCVQCGSTEPKDRLKAELAKCQVLCRPCHQAKTARDLGYAEHGWWRYRKGCRCDICRAANAQHARTVRANKKAREQS